MSTFLFDTIPGSTASGFSVPMGGSNSGFINSGADQDWFRVNLVNGQQYIFDVTGGSLGDPTLSLRNSLGALITSNDDGGPGLNSRIEYTSNATFLRYLDVGSFGSGTGGYTVTARIDDAVDDIYGLDAITVGGTRTGTINTGADQDFYRVTLVAGQQYIFDVDQGTVDPTLALRNSAGTQLLFNDDGGPGLDSRIEFTAATSGTYYLDVGSFGSNTGNYTLAARVDDVANDTDTTDSLTIGFSRSGTIETGADQDFFRVSLTAGQSYIFDVDGGTVDPTLALRNSSGTQIAFNDDGGPGLDSRIEFTAGATGTYFLDVGSFSTRTGTYSLAARVDDVADDVNSIDIAPLVGNPLGTINSASDQDWWQVNLVAGTRYALSVDGVGLSDATLALRNGAGTQLAFNDDGGPGFDPLITFTATSTGTYFMDVGGFGSGTGTYRVDVDIA